MLISADNHVFPAWAPEWLQAAVESPDCSIGTHPCLRALAKWLIVYFAENDGEAERWLRYAAEHCHREVPAAEVDRLLVWAEKKFLGEDRKPAAEAANTPQQRPRVDLEEIYRIACEGPRLEDYRAASPVKLELRRFRYTATALQDWGRYAGQADPLICFGADDRFWTRPFSAVREILHVHAQIVPSPMRTLRGLTADGRWSEHSLEGTGPRNFLVTEFDFAKATPKGQPTIWAPLLERCEAAGISVLDLNAALLAHLARERPLWMTVFSGGKSLQGWFPCRGFAEEELHRWFTQSARRMGACNSTWCKSQFVRMPDGTRAPNREGKCVRQSIIFYNPSVL